MSHSENKVRWCLKKAEKELKKGDKHKGIIKIKPDLKLSRAHLKKAEHNLKAIIDFKKIGYSDWSASAAFYSIYHCFLAILVKFGYESQNQECTFSLIENFIETGKINLDQGIVKKVRILDPRKGHESSTIIGIRETEQYGVKLSLDENNFDKILKVAKTILDYTKEVIV